MSGAEQTPTSARRRATRERLLTAATQVFLERGVVLASVEEICEAAGFTRGAFYSNFADKHELLEALLARESEAVLAALTALCDPAGGVHDVPDVISRFFALSPLGRDHYLIHTELTLAAIRDPQAYELFRALGRTQFERMGEAVKATLRLAGLEPAVDLRDLTEVLYGIIERSVASALLDGDPGEVDAVARRMLPTVVAALTRPIDCP